MRLSVTVRAEPESNTIKWCQCLSVEGNVSIQKLSSIYIKRIRRKSCRVINIILIIVANTSSNNVLQVALFTVFIGSENLIAFTFHFLNLNIIINLNSQCLYFLSIIQSIYLLAKVYLRFTSNYNVIYNCLCTSVANCQVNKLIVFMKVLTDYYYISSLNRYEIFLNWHLSLIYIGQTLPTIIGML